MITDRERPQFVDPQTGALSDEGKRFMERAVLGSVVDDSALLDVTPPSILNKVGGSVADLAKLMGRGDEWDITPLVREAMRQYHSMTARGLDLDTFLGQRGMLGAERNPAVDAMMRLLAEPPKAVKATLRQFAADAAQDLPGQASMFGKPEPWKTFNELFGAKVPKEDYNTAVHGGAENEYGNHSRAGEGRVAAQGSAEGGTAAALAYAGGAVPPGLEGSGGPGGAGLASRPGTEGPASGQPLSWRSAVNLRSKWFADANDYSGRLKPFENAIYARQTELLDNAMEEAARRAGDDVYATWRRANAGNKALQEDWNSARSPLSGLVERGRPTPDVKVPGSLLDTGNLGGNPANIRALKTKGFDLGPLQAELLNRIRDAGFKVSRGKLAGYSEDFLREVLPSQTVDDLYRLGAAARALKFEVNPSGTSDVLTGREQLRAAAELLALPLAGITSGGAVTHSLAGAAEGAALGLGVPYVAAKLANSSRLARFLSEPPGRPVRGEFARMAGRRLEAGRVAPFLAAASAESNRQGQ